MKSNDPYDQLFLLEEQCESLPIESDSDIQANESDAQLEAENQAHQLEISEQILFNDSQSTTKPDLKPTTLKAIAQIQNKVEILNEEFLNEIEEINSMVKET